MFVSGDPHGTWFSVSGVDYEYVSGVDYEYVSRTSTRVYEKRASLRYVGYLRVKYSDSSQWFTNKNALSGWTHQAFLFFGFVVLH